MVQQVDNKLKGWKMKTLSWAGRNTLIKSVVQAILTYTMSAFDVPKQTCEQLDKQKRRFWWKGDMSSNMFKAWKDWRYLCNPKCEGGLGFREFKAFNQALIAKLGWLVVLGHESLCTKMLKAKYKVRGGWLNGGKAQHASQIWRGIEKSRAVLKKGACFVIGNGQNVRIWEDPWGHG